MDNKGKIENLKLFHTMCSSELEQAIGYIDIYKKKINEISSFISVELQKNHESQVYLLAYDKALSDLMYISELTRKFNIKCEIALFNLYNEFYLPQDVKNNGNSHNYSVSKSLTNSDNHDTIYNEFHLPQKTKTIEIANDVVAIAANDNNYSNNINYIEKEQFSYIEPDRNKIKSNRKIDCIITSIKDKTDNLFYININDNPKYIECVRKLHEYKQRSPQCLDHFPEEGEVFGLIIDNYMFRAVRENSHNSRKNLATGNSFKAYLIDTGEIYDVTSDMKIYYIPYDCRILASQAILCKLKMVNFSENVDFKGYLRDHLYAKDKMIVMEEQNSIFHVNLVGDTNPFTNYSLSENYIAENKQNQLSSNYSNFYDNFKNSSSNVTASNNLEKTIHYNNFENTFTKTLNLSQKNFSNNNNNNIDQELISFDNNDDAENDDNFSCDENRTYNKSSSSSSEIKETLEKCNTKVTNKTDENICDGALQLSERELEILNEEPLNTTNALKAVLGYVPKDEKRICRFYNPKTGACFKGSHCQLEHVEILKDGWTRDEAETLIDIKNKLIYPSVGEFISLFPTCLLNMEIFYAQSCQTSYQLPTEIHELILKMNSTKVKESFQKLNSPPVTFQLVIALYKDNLWYRARVLDIINDYTFKIFFVDFGDTAILGIEYIRKWEPKFDYLPFQAIKCQIAGIQAKEDNSLFSAGMKQLKRIILNRKLEAKVLHIIEEDILLVQLYDEDGYNVGERLISMGYAKENQIKFLNNSNTLLPG